MNPVLVAIAIAAAAPNPPAPNQLAPDQLSNDVSIMAYNVHGLPWPFAKGRPDALRTIGARLAEMRARGSEPHLVLLLLQEAFTEDAKAIGREAGYPYSVAGPGRAERRSEAADPRQQQFARAARWIKGEGDGTLEDSGLLILSDYQSLMFSGCLIPVSPARDSTVLRTRAFFSSGSRSPGSRSR